MILCLSWSRPLCPSASIPFYPSIPHLLCPFALFSLASLYLVLSVPQALCTSTFVPLNHLPLGISVHCPLFFGFKVPLLLCRSACLSLSISVPRPLCLLASCSFVLSFVSLCSLLPFCPSAPLFIIVTQPCGSSAYLAFSVYLSASPFLNHSVPWPLSPSAAQSLSPSAIDLCVAWSLCPRFSVALGLSVPQPLCCSASLSRSLSFFVPSALILSLLLPLGLYFPQPICP